MLREPDDGNQAVDRAVPRTGKPRRPKWPAESVLHAARGALVDGDLGLAETLARRALEGRPGRNHSADARLVLAKCAELSGDLVRAIRAYRRVADRYRGLPAGEKALVAAALLEAGRGRTDIARALLQAYLKRYPSGTLTELAQARILALGGGS